MTDAYQQAYRRSISDPEGFWEEAAHDVKWIKTWDKVFDDSNAPFVRWFAGGQCNTCYNAVDRHVEEGRGEQTAIIYDSPLAGVCSRITYAQLQDLTARFAGVLSGLGVKKGDRVIIYMPVIPAAAVAMLACARIGAIHSVVFGGFASNELAVRIDDAQPKVVVSASCGLEGQKIVRYKELLDQAITMAAHKPRHTVILARPQAEAALTAGRDLDWDAQMALAAPQPCTPVEATDPLYILYTSGTTGQPKGVVRDHGGHMVALKWSMKYVYNVLPGQVFWGASDVGWIVGHSYMVYGPLLQGCTTVIYEGKPVGTPDAGAFWRVISQHKVETLFTAPTAFRAIKRDDPGAVLIKKYDLSHFRALFLAGERSDPDTLLWAEKNLKVPVIDHWWQTELGWPAVCNCLGLKPFPVKHGSPSKIVPGWQIEVLNESREPCKPGQTGALVLKLPLPPGALLTLWNADQRFLDSYTREFPGYYKTADAGYIDEDGYVYVMGRTDDVINVAGHRLSTGAMEEVLSNHPDIAECAVIGVDDAMKGQLPVGFLVLKAGANRDGNEILREVVSMVRERIGPVAAFKNAVVVRRLPKTRSGKILRGTMQKIANFESFKTPATIDDETILGEIEESLTAIGYASARAALQGR